MIAGQSWQWITIALVTVAFAGWLLGMVTHEAIYWYERRKASAFFDEWERQHRRYEVDGR
jgi:hypothetical protein